MARNAGHPVEYLDPDCGRYHAGGPRAADGVALPALHRRDDSNGYTAGYQPDGSLAHPDGAGGRRPAAALLLYDDHGTHEANQCHPSGSVQPALRPGTLQRPDPAFGRCFFASGQGYRRGGRGDDFPAAPHAGHAGPVAGCIPADALDGPLAGLGPVGTHTAGHCVRQGNRPPVAQDDPGNPRQGKPYPDAGAGGGGTQCRVAFPGQRAVGDRTARRYTRYIDGLGKETGSFHGGHARGPGLMLQPGLSDGFCLGRPATSRRCHHIRCHDFVPAVGQPDSESNPDLAQHGAATHSFHGQHRPAR